MQYKYVMYELYITRIFFPYDTYKYDSYKYDTYKFDTYKFDTYKFDTYKYDIFKYDTSKYETYKYAIYKYDTYKYAIYKYDTNKYTQCHEQTPIMQCMEVVTRWPRQFHVQSLAICPLTLPTLCNPCCCCGGGWVYRKCLVNDWSKGELVISVTSKKSPNVYKSCQKMNSLTKLKILTPLQILPNNVRDLGKLSVAKGFEKLPKVQ